jgi:hypothetical protein
MTKARISSGPFSCAAATADQGAQRALELCESTQLSEKFVTFRATVDVPARFHKVQNLWADATQAPVGLQEQKIHQ